MKLSKYRNRHIDYKNENFIRFYCEIDDIELLSNNVLKEIHLYNPNQSQIDQLPSKITADIVALNIWGGSFQNCDSLQELKNIEYLSIIENSKLKSICSIEKNKKLKGLGIIGCNKFESLQFLSNLENLSEFHLAGGIWKKQKIKSLRPISSLKNLIFLSLSQLNIIDANHSPLFGLKRLEEIIISENMFTTEQFAELSVHLETSKCRCFKGYTEHKEIYLDPENCKENRIQIVGSRKPELDPKTQSERIQKYISEFNVLKNRFRIGK